MRKMNRLGLSVAIVAALGLGLSACTSSGATPETGTATGKSRLHQILDSKKIRIAVSPENAGWGIQTADGGRQGYDIEIAQALADSLGAEAEWVNTDDASRIPLLQTDKADVVIATFTALNERAQQVQMTIPYAGNSDSVVVPADSPIQTLADLADADVAVAAGSAGEARLRERLPEANPVPFPSVADSVQAIKSNKVDALIQNTTLVHELTEDGAGKFRMLEENLGDSIYVMGVKEGDERWLNYLDNFIRNYVASGEANASYQKWFGVDLPGAVR